jgi:hypothetical protein
MWKAFQRYRALDPQARTLFWRAAVLLPQIALSLRFSGFKTTKENLERKLSTAPRNSVQGSESAADAVQKTCRMLQAAVHYGIVHPTCLPQSLALWYLLGRQGISSDLRIGVRKLSSKFEAHAWVEYQGLALNQAEEQHQHYSAFDAPFSDLPGDQP